MYLIVAKLQEKNLHGMPVVRIRFICSDRYKEMDNFMCYPDAIRLPDVSHSDIYDLAKELAQQDGEGVTPDPTQAVREMIRDQVINTMRCYDMGPDGDVWIDVANSGLMCVIATPTYEED